MSKLDDISVAIGELRTAVKTLQVRGSEDREAQTKRHADNQAALGEIRQDTAKAIGDLRIVASDRWNDAKLAIEGLRRDLREHAEAVRNMQPQISALQVSRGKLAALAAIGLLALWLIGRALEALLSAGASRVIEHLSQRPPH